MATYGRSVGRSAALPSDGGCCCLGLVLAWGLGLALELDLVQFVLGLDVVAHGYVAVLTAHCVHIEPMAVVWAWLLLFGFCSPCPRAICNGCCHYASPILLLLLFYLLALGLGRCRPKILRLGQGCSGLGRAAGPGSAWVSITSSSIAWLPGLGMLRTMLTVFPFPPAFSSA
jgi:hypothetical protein